MHSPIKNLWPTVLYRPAVQYTSPRRQHKGFSDAKPEKLPKGVACLRLTGAPSHGQAKQSPSSAMQSPVLCRPCCCVTQECTTQVLIPFHAFTMASFLLLRSVESTISLLKTSSLSGWTLDTLTRPLASMSTYATSPSASSPFRMASDRASSTIRVMARLRGRAPYSCTDDEAVVQALGVPRLL